MAGPDLKRHARPFAALGKQRLDAVELVLGLGVKLAGRAVGIKPGDPGGDQDVDLFTQAGIVDAVVGVDGEQDRPPCPANLLAFS